jgi:hypothetical protein
MLVLSNAPFWLLSSIYYLNRPVLSVDGLFICIALYRFRVPMITVLLMAWIFDGLLSLSLIFRFPSALDFVEAAKFLPQLQITRFLSAEFVLVIVPFIIFALAILYLRNVRARPSWPITLGVIVPLIVLDAVNGTSAISRANVQLIKANIAGSAVTTLVSSYLRTPSSTLPRRLAPNESIGHEAGVVPWLASDPRHTALIVVVESLGLPLDPHLHEWIAAQLLNATSPSEYDVQELAVPYLGKTVDGELRTLCGLAGDVSRVTPQAAVADCIPAQVSILGIPTVALHGFSHRMFSRDQWWPTLGFQKTLFAEELRKQHPPECGGGFRGVCDATVIEAATKLLSTGEARLAYVLTLNTHLPIGPGPVPAGLSKLCATAGTPDDVCHLLAGAATALSAIRDQVAKLEVKPMIVVVGDHAPPFASTKSRLLFDQHNVPGWILRPRNANRDWHPIALRNRKQMNDS